MVRRRKRRKLTLLELAAKCEFVYTPVVVKGHHDLEYFDALPYPIKKWLRETEAYFLAYDIWEECKRGTSVADILHVLNGMAIEYRSQILDIYKGIARKDA